MLRYLLAGTALTTLAAPLAAQTLVETKRTQPVRTSELKAGAGDSVKVTKDGSIELTNGTAIVVDSDHDATNEGKIVVTNANGASGIRVEGPRQTTITNSGTITIDETYTPTDTDNDGDLDGPFAVGSGRAGIRVDGGLTGRIEHSGTILVEGNDSFGIVVTGPLDGDLRHDGKTAVLGTGSVGLRVNDISGNARVAGEIRAVGQGAAGVQLLGDIDGALVVQGDISATGYRFTTAPSNTSKLDTDDLLQGGSALTIEGDVARGIVFAVAPKDTKPGDNDEDKDGIEDAKEGNAKIVSYGTAPAVVLGSASRDIAIGATEGTGTGFGVIVDGTIGGRGVYTGVDATGMVIAGRGGGVAIENGMLVAGTIDASSLNASATALRIGDGATLPQLHSSGTISASATGSQAGDAAAVVIESGANLPVLRNSGTIKASTGATSGSAAAIIDRSGTLGLVENSGKITAAGAAASSGRSIALDLSARTTATTVKQTAVAAGIAAPAIEGDIRFGIGDDLFDVADGSVTGRTTFAGGIDRLRLSGDAVYSGSVDFGGQADNLEILGSARIDGSVDFGGGAGTLAINDKGTFTGRLLGSQNVTASVTGGTLDITGPARLASLDVGATGVLVATVGGDAASATAITVGGTAQFADGAKIRVRLTDITNAIGTYDILTAGTLVGAGDLESDSALVPFMFAAELAVSGNTISIDIERKDAEELGLNRSETTAFDALYEALSEDEDVAGIFLRINDGDVFQAFVAQTLPDHAGGAFEGINQGLRTFNRHFIDPQGPFDEEGKLRLIAETAYWGGSKERGETASYELDGLGFRGGAELLTSFGAVGATASWLWNEHRTGFENDIISNSYEFGVHWRGKFGPVSAFTRGAIGQSDFEGHRNFTAGTGEDKVELLIDRDWSGTFYGLSSGIALEGGSQFFFFRPSLTADYLKLDEDGYVETGGGDALNLTVDRRKSDQLALNLGLAAGADLFGMKSHDEFWLRLEAEGGWREVVAGTPGETTARYGDGEAFTLVPEANEGGWFARIKALGGDGWYRLGGEVGAEQQFGELGYSLRASLSFSL